MSSTTPPPDTPSTVVARLVVAALPAGRCPAGAPPPASVSLSLTAKEAAILEVLRGTVASRGLGSQVRIAGGWVRDKLLGVASHDIDVSVDNMSGADFAHHVNAFLASRGEATSSIGVIQANPDQSKHLETAATRVLGEWIDFVGLRAEAYDAASRIPRVSLGTPTQDALRRDFTVNALFFNVTDGAVEDLTGQGWVDLGSRTLRTPLPPLVTFRDDPLRLLRAVRFSARLGFVLDSDLRAAAADALVQGDLRDKVSRERVGIETEAMLAGPRPVAALRVLFALGLVGSVFAPLPPLPAAGGATSFARLGGQVMVPGARLTAPGAPSVLHALACPGALDGADAAALPLEWVDVGRTCVEALAYTLSLAARVGGARGGAFWTRTTAEGESTPPLSCPAAGFCSLVDASHPEAQLDASVGDLEALGISAPDERRAIVTAALLSPLAKVSRAVVTSGSAGVKSSRPEALVCSIIADGLKRRRRDADDVVAILSGACALRDALETPTLSAALQTWSGGASIAAPRWEPSDVLAVGLALRGEAKAHWRSALLLALAWRLVPILFDPSASTSDSCTPTGAGIPEPWRGRVGDAVALHRALAHSIVHDWHLDGCWAWKPPLNGSELRAELGSAAVGPALGAIMEKQARWQLLNPEGLRDAALEFLQRKE